MSRFHVQTVDAVSHYSIGDSEPRLFCFTGIAGFSGAALSYMQKDAKSPTLLMDKFSMDRRTMSSEGKEAMLSCITRLDF